MSNAMIPRNAGLMPATPIRPASFSIKYMLKTCKVCGKTKDAVRGIWVVKHSMPEGRTCLACLGAVNLQRYYDTPKVLATDIDEHTKTKNREYYKAKSAKFRSTALGRKSASLYSLAWAANNPGKRNAKNAKRHAVKLQRTPPWADFKKIEEIYVAAQNLTKTTGILHAVDHVIPLQGKLISGLHVESNLQILTFSENSSKSNKFVI